MHLRGLSELWSDRNADQETWRIDLEKTVSDAEEPIMEFSNKKNPTTLEQSF